MRAAPPAELGDSRGQLANSDVWAAQADIAAHLATWAAVSLVGGGVLALVGQLRGHPTMRAFGLQNAGWGAVDLAIAGVASAGRKTAMRRAPDPGDHDIQSRQRRSLRRTLLVNAGLDVGYVAAGLAGLVWSLRAGPRPAAVGHCCAVVVQGGFLLAFDTLHARALPEDS